MLELPRDYIVHKFFELGYFAQYNSGDDTYCCSCPVCHEGDSGIGNKKRCYYLPSTNVIYCHRCGTSLKPLNWIRRVGNMTTAQVKREIEDLQYDVIDLDREDYTKNYFSKSPEEPITDLPYGTIDVCDKVVQNFYKDNKIFQNILEYLNKRRLLTAKNRPDKWFTTLTDKIHANRLIIPFYDINQRALFYQSRDITGKAPSRYMSKKHGIRSIFNVDKLDLSLKVFFIFEGPFDSCFVKNGVAVGGITPGEAKFTTIQLQQLRELEELHRVWILDSPYCDDTARRKAEFLLQDGEMVFVWPIELGLAYKDFNEWCIAERLDEIKLSTLAPYIMQGQKGLDKFHQLMKEAGIT